MAWLAVAIFAVSVGLLAGWAMDLHAARRGNRSTREHR